MSLTGGHLLECEHAGERPTLSAEVIRLTFKSDFFGVSKLCFIYFKINTHIII